MQTGLINNNSEKLIIFLTGWGCDYNQFRFMKSSEYDVLICYDYTNLDLHFDFSKYKECNLIAFSAGVCVASVIKDKLPQMKKKIAINGNPLAYNEHYGLRKEILEVFAGVRKETALEFRREFLVYDDKEFKMFNSTQPLRTFDSCKEELLSLKSYYNEDITLIDFDVAVLSKNDKIFYFDWQKEYWSDKSQCVILDNCAHYPFFRLDSFEKIMTCDRDLCYVG